MYVIIGIFSFVIGTIPLLLGIYVYRFLNKELRILVAYFGMSTLTSIALMYLTTRAINGLWLLYVFPIIEYPLLVVIFSFWQSDMKIRLTFLWSIPLYVALGIILICTQNLRMSNSLGISIESVLMVGITAYTLFDLNRKSEELLFREPGFWIASALLMNFICTILFFALNNLILSLPIETAQMIWALKNIIGIIANLIIVKGLLCQYQAQKSFGR
jgi:hypothetical protein